MEKKDLITLLDNIFIPLNFKRKGNNWVLNDKEITKIINLQKSQYGNVYYLHYDYIINSLPLNKRKVHIDNQLGSSDKEEQKYIQALLNLENDIDQTERLFRLDKLIHEKIVSQMKSVQSEEDLLRLLQERTFLYTIPPHVLKHFNLKTEW
ncbi:hypothetical protein D3C80_1484010 [compost metagenome]